MANITDIDVLTLEHTLKNLRLIDLYSIMYANTHLRNAGRLEFVHRFKNKRIILRLLNIDSVSDDEIGNEITVYRLKNILRFLRCFGDLLNEVTVIFLDSCPLKTFRLINYLSLFCSRFLTKIRFENLNVDIFSYFNRCFINVKMIEFVSSTISENFKHLSLFFPNVETISFYGWNMISFNNFIELTANCEFLTSIKRSNVIIHIFD